VAFATRARDPDDKLDYLIDWQGGASPGLADGETISTSTWTAYTSEWVESEDIVVHDELNEFTDTTATGWQSGGTRGAITYFTNHIVTDQGRELSYSIKINIKEQ
jgi:hypothetical protein